MRHVYPKHDPLLMTMGSRIRAARERMELTQAQLAQRVGVTTQAVQLWEYDKTQPRPQRVAQLAQVLETSREWLLAVDAPSHALEVDIDRLARAIRTAHEAVRVSGLQLELDGLARLIAHAYRDDGISTEALARLVHLAQQA